VIEFTSPAGAKEATAFFVKAAIHALRGTKLSRFTVTGVPGSKGVIAREGGTTIAYWREGRCALSDFGFDSVQIKAAPLTQPVIAGIQRLYKRTHGACP
jgi:hypothetical protein